MRLRVDPWDPEYGASVELDDDLAPPVGLDLDVEVAGAWEPIDHGLPSDLTTPCCAFVDGVRRIDARLFAEEGSVEAPGLAGCYAVGAAWSTLPPKVDSVAVGRLLVVGGNLTAPTLNVEIGSTALQFDPWSVAGAAPLDPLRGLQNAMRDAEARLARQLHDAGGADVVVCDGPLSYFSLGPVVGLVKRQSRSYLDADRGRVVGQLEAGQRTPMFKLGEQRLERYSWYLRLTTPRPIDGAMAGVVRMEVAAAQGLAAAQELAALTSAVLPRFAPQPGRDARAPQNLFPVGALETVLRHRLGDGMLIRRALELRLLEEVSIG